MCGGHGTVAGEGRGGGGMEIWEQANTTVMKVWIGKHCPCVDQSTNKCDLDFFEHVFTMTIIQMLNNHGEPSFSYLSTQLQWVFSIPAPLATATIATTC